MKAVLIINLPDDDVELYNIDYELYKSTGDADYIDITEEQGCPLRPLPHFKYIDTKDEHDDLVYEMGWNACLDELLGETE